MLKAPAGSISVEGGPWQLLFKGKKSYQGNLLSSGDNSPLQQKIMTKFRHNPRQEIDVSGCTIFKNSAILCPQLLSGGKLCAAVSAALPGSPSRRHLSFLTMSGFASRWCESSWDRAWVPLPCALVPSQGRAGTVKERQKNFAWLSEGRHKTSWEKRKKRRRYTHFEAETGR